MRRRILGILAGLAGVALVLVFAFTSLECVRVEYDTAPKAEVRNDPFLAFEQILTGEYPLTRYDGPEYVDLSDCSYLILYGDQIAYFGAGTLESWIRAGGKLQIVFDETRPIPDEHWWDTAGEAFVSVKPSFISEREENTESILGGSQDIEASVENSEVMITVDRHVRFPSANSRGSTIQVKKNGNTYALVRNLGKGFVLASGRPYFMTNQFLRKQDNLRFVSELIRHIEFEKDGYIWIPEPPPIEKTVVKPLETGPVFVSIAALCIFVFWSRMPRFGPSLPETPADQRSLKERFAAEGRFLWRYRPSAAVIRKLGTQASKQREMSAGESLVYSIHSKQLIQEIGNEVKKRQGLTNLKVHPSETEQKGKHT